MLNLDDLLSDEECNRMLGKWLKTGLLDGYDEKTQAILAVLLENQQKNLGVSKESGEVNGEKESGR